MNEEDMKNLVRELTSILGGTAVDFPASSVTPSPDFELLFGDELTLAELKSRDSSWVLTEEEDDLLDRGGIVHNAQPLTGIPTARSRIAKACEQLRSAATQRHAFRIIWYCVYGGFAELAKQRIKTNLLGDQTVFETDSNRQWAVFFFHYAEFFKHRAVLDAAILTSIDDNQGNATAQLVPNPLSDRYEALKKSRLYDAFHSGLCDPLEIIQEGKGLILGADADRTSERTKLDYLEKRHQIRDPFIIPMGHTVAMKRPR